MDKLKPFIDNARAKGYSDERIKSALLKAGWSSDRIDQALVADKPSAEAMPARPTPSVTPLQTDQQTDNQTDGIDLENLNIDSDKPAASKQATVPIQAKRPAAGKKPLIKRLLPVFGAALILLAGLIIATSGLKSYNHSRVPGGFVVTRGQVVFSIPGKKGTYDTRVNFKVADGSTHGFVTPTPAGSNNNSRYVTGDGMKVAYYPRNPDVSGMDLTDRGSPAVGLAVAALGLIITFIGAFFLQKQLRRKKT